MTRRGGLTFGAALILGLVLAWWAPDAGAQSTVFKYDGAGNMTGAASTLSDPANCGAVGNACPAGQGCCSGTCVDLATSRSNCGTCGKVCAGKPPVGVCYQATCFSSCPSETCPINGTCGPCIPPVIQTQKAATLP